MAERRMFTKKVTDDDNFMSLSASAQALYLHLSMSADDDGFCNQVSIAMFKAHASIQDLEALLSKRYIYQFENGVIVIKHWRMANALRKDRYTPTAFQEELKQLKIKDNGSYTMQNEDLVANWLPDGCQVSATGKDRLYKDSKEENREDNIPPKSPKGKTDWQEEMIDERGITGKLKETIMEFIEYKKEKKQSYKPRGFKSFLTELQGKVSEYGDQAVIDCINYTMSRNYDGVSYWSLNKNQKKNNGNKEDVMEIARKAGLI